MKKFRFSLAVSLFLLLLGCQSEDLENQPIPIGNHSLVATIEGQDYIDVSRTAVDDSGNVTWITTDELGVYGSISENVKYSSTGNGSDVTFTGNLPETETAEWAYYPYNKDASLNEGELTITLPDQYTYTGNSNAPMLGKPSGNDKFSFKHLGGLIRFTLGGGIPDDADRFVITSMGENQPVAGQASFAIEGDNVTMSITGEGKQSISYDVSAINDAKEFQHFFVPLPVGDYIKLQVSFYKKNSDTPVFTRSLSNLTVKRAEMICMPILDWNTGKQYTLSENTTDLTDLSEDGVTVTLKESDNSLQLTGLEESEIPEVGQILWSQPTEELPYGFMGKVKETTSSNGTVTITTETVGLDEVFDKLLINEKVALIPTDNQSRSAVLDETPNFNLSLNIGDDKKCYSANGGIDIATHLIVYIDLDKNRKVSQISMTIEADATFHADMSVKASYNDSGDTGTYSLGKKTFNPVVLAYCVVIVPEIQFNFHGTPSGEINFSSGLEYKTKGILGVEYLNGIYQYRGNGIELDEASPWDMKSSVSMNGSFFCGLGLECKAKFYNQENMKISLNPQIGIDLSGEIKIDSSAENIQESLKDAHLTMNNVLKGSVKVDASIIADQLAVSFDVDPFKWDERELYLLPMFENLAAQTRMMTSGSRASTDPFEATITMTGSRELLSKFMRITTTIVNEADDNDIQYGDYVDYEVIGGGSSSQDFTTIFSNLNSDKEYKAYPKISSPILGEELNNELELTEQNVSFRSPVMDLRDQLIQLYKNTGGENWTNNENWLSDKPIEEWYGIYESDGKYDIMLPNNNLIGTFSLSCPDIQAVNVSNNQIENFCLAGCTNLFHCEIDNNPLVTLDLSECENLEYFPDFSDASCLESLSYLNIKNCQLIQYIHTNLDNSPLKYLNFSGCVMLEGFSGSGIPWELMEEFYAKDCVRLPLSIEIYPCMKVLDTENCEFLQHVFYNRGAASVLKSINVKGCKSLKRLECPDSGMIKSLDLTGCESLEHLNCGGNLLTELDIAHCSLLSRLSCDYNELSELDVTNNPSLTDLSCGGNNLTELDVASCPLLKNLYCGDNPLTHIDISRNPELEIFSCANTEIESLDFSNNPSVREIRCGNNKIMKLNLNNCTELTDLTCHNNQLTAIDLKGKNKLETLLCSQNPISSLDLSDTQNSLKFLSCEDTEIKSINVNNFATLEKVILSGISLIEFYHANCHALKLASVCETSLTSLDLSNCASLEQLSCEENAELKSLNLSGCSSMVILNAYNNPKLTDLTLMSNAPLEQVDFSKTKVCMEIPSFFPPVSYADGNVYYFFHHEPRYTNYERVYDASSEKWVVTYTDNGYGWWFPGEPDSGRHGR